MLNGPGGIGARQGTCALMVLLTSVASWGMSPTAAGQESTGSNKSLEHSESNEIRALRTETSRTFQNPDGSHTLEVFATPIHYVVKRHWEEIDNALVPSQRPGYAYENAANAYKLLIPNDIASTPVRIEIGEEWLEFRPLGASGSPIVDGNRATFPSAIEDVDIIYEAGNAGVEELFRLPAPTSPNEFDFSLDTSPGLEPEAPDSGGVPLGTVGDHSVSFAPLIMYEEADESAQSGRVEFAVSEVAEGSTAPEMTVDAADAWLENAEREYPVIIDPPVEVTGPEDTKDCWIYEVDSGDCTTGAINLGKINGSARRGLAQFVLPDYLNTSIPINSATLTLYAKEAPSAFAVDVHRIANGWTECVTWTKRNKPGTGCSDAITRSWNSPGGDFIATPEASIGNISGTGFKHWPVTGVVKGWVSGLNQNHGFLLKVGSELAGRSVIFNSSDAVYPQDSKLPTLTIDIDPLDVSVASSTTGPRFTDWGYDIKNEAEATKMAQPKPPQVVGQPSVDGLAEKIFSQPDAEHPGRLGMDVLRIPIFAASHSQSGYSANLSAYDIKYADVVAAVKRAKAAKPNVRIFASLKLEGEQTLPEFARTLREQGDGDTAKEQLVKPAEYELLLRDFLAYMKTKSINIDVLGVDNEAYWNKAGITLAVHDTIADSLRADCANTTPPPFVCPTSFIGPEVFEPNKWIPTETTAVIQPVDWLDARWNNVDYRDAINIAGTHYYSKARDDAPATGVGSYVDALNRFADAANNTSRTTTLWDSEFHWNLDAPATPGGENEGMTEIDIAARGLISGFDHFDKGFQGIVWWDLIGPSSNTDTATIQSDLVRSTTDSFAVNAAGADGDTVLRFGSLNLRAFKSGTQMNLWAVNDSGTDKVRSIVIQGTTLPATAPATVTQWTSERKTMDNKSVTRDLALVMPAHSVTYLRVPNAYPAP